MIEHYPFSEEFEQQVRDCLGHLYDFAALQNDPVAQQLTPQLSGVQRVQTVRQIMVDAIENLNLNKANDLQSKQGRVYNLLFLRYVEEQSTQEVLHQLALSERQFYREHKRAVQALSQVLWERITRQKSPSASTISVQTEVQRAYNPSEYAYIDVAELFAGVAAATQSLAEQYHVTMAYHSDDFAELYTHRLILRQTVIWLTSQLIRHMASGGQLSLAQKIEDLRSIIEFRVEGPNNDYATLQKVLKDHETLSLLTKTLQADVEYGSGGPFVVQLKLPLHQRTVLTIDDNPDFVSLIRRFLAHLPYTIVAAQNADEGIQAARELKPHVIILDVMLPGKDGWEILQNLKNHPSTKHIPVFICSVLDTPDLALSLGADGFLKKPPEQHELLHMLRHWVQ